ncbi:30S ribosomal protein S17e [Candidatus Woesearchaeota archaeon]|nr:30S ribosomal protein S17e [Candidatus Woesearchaeota archaeon]
MGRIKTMLIKRTVNNLIKEHKGMFSNSFDKNKNAVSSVLEIKSKKLRNVIAGYVTKRVKETK